MVDRWFSIIFAIAAVGFGIDNIVNERGSHILGRLGPHYTGIAAVLEGVVFIAVGCVLLYRVWVKRDPSRKK